VEWHGPFPRRRVRRGPLSITGKSFTIAHTFTASGIYPVTVSVSDGDPGGRSTREFRIIVRREIGDWRTQHFGSNQNSGDAATMADPDGDGLKNAVEFAFGLDPRKSDATKLPSARLASNLTYDPFPDGQPPAGGTPEPTHLTSSFIEPPGITGVTYGAQYSADLVAWTPIADTGSGGTHSFSVERGTDPRLYMRLVVTIAP